MGLAQSLEETTEHRRGCQPPVEVRQQKKPRRGDRVFNMLFTKQLDVLSPLWGFRFVDVPVPGVSTPVCGLSRLRRFSSDNNNTIYNMYARTSLVRTSGTLFLFAFGKGPFLLPYLPKVRTSPRITCFESQRKLSFYKD